MRWIDVEVGDLIVSTKHEVLPMGGHRYVDKTPFIVVGMFPITPGYVRINMLAPDMKPETLMLRDDSNMLNFRLLQRCDIHAGG